MSHSTVFKTGDFVAPREGESLGIVVSAKPFRAPDTFWTVWIHDEEWWHPEPLDALRPADIPPPARFLGQMLRNYRVIAQNPNRFPRQQPLISALRRGIQWHEHGPLPSVEPNGGRHGR